MPATLDDVESIIGRKPEWRVRGIAARLDGKAIGVGGAVYKPDGVWAFVAMKPEARKYPVATHRAGLMAIKLFRELGLSRVVALAEDGIVPAERWLLRLGFKRNTEDGITTFIWGSNG